MDTIIKDLKSNELLCIPISDPRTRKKIHQYIENKYPSMNKTSTSSNLFDRDRKTFMKECFHCNKGKGIPLEYRYGMMENNIDEYYSGICRECHENVSWEPNYDDSDNIFRIIKNNMILVGEYLDNEKPKHAKKGKFGDKPTDKIDDMIDKVYKIKSPDIRLRGKNLVQYLDSTIDSEIQI